MSSPDLSPDSGHRARAFVRRATWTFASSMPWHPHEYVARRDCRQQGIESDFLDFVQTIEDEGYWRLWGKHRWRSLALDEHVYWLHWELWPVEERTIVNRWWRERMAPDSGQLTLELDA